MQLVETDGSFSISFGAYIRTPTRPKQIFIEFESEGRRSKWNGKVISEQKFYNYGFLWLLLFAILIWTQHWTFSSIKSLNSRPGSHSKLHSFVERSRRSDSFPDIKSNSKLQLCSMRFTVAGANWSSSFETKKCWLMHRRCVHLPLAVATTTKGTQRIIDTGQGISNHVIKTLNLAFGNEKKTKPCAIHNNIQQERINRWTTMKSNKSLITLCS